MRGSLPATPQLQRKLEELIAAEQYEQAFTAALSTGNSDVVLWLCKKVPVRILPNEPGRPAPLSQEVLLGLLAELGNKLSRGTATKLSWLKETVLALDPHSPSVMERAPAVIDALLAALQQQAEALPSAAPAISAVSGRLRTLQDLLRK